MALQYKTPFDAQIWQKGHKHVEDAEWNRRRTLVRPVPAHKATVVTLLRAARALSERADVTEYAEALANYLEVSREQLYSMPLAEFIERYESARLTEEINAAYDEELEQEDEEFLAHVKNYQGRILDAED